MNPPSSSGRMLSVWGPGLALACMLLVCFGPSLTGGFLWCDDYTVAENPDLLDGAGLARIWRGGVTEQYYPLTYTLYFAVVQVAGAEPGSLRFVSLVMHGLCVVLLWRLLLRWCRPSVAWVGAALFGLHPIVAESVCWIYELKNPWSTCWLLLSAAAWFRFRDGAGRQWYGLALVCFVVGLLSKSAVLVLPVWLFVLERWRPPARRPWTPLLPMVVFAGASAIVTMTYESQVTGAVGVEWSQDWPTRILVAGQSIWFYVGRFLAPWDLAFAYPRFDTGGAIAIAACIAVVGLTGLVFWMSRHRNDPVRRAGRGTGLWWLMYGAALVPVSGLFDIYMHRYTFVADHLAYLPWLVTAPFVARLLLGGAEAGAIRGRGIVAVTVLVLVGFLSNQRSVSFRSDAVLWQESLDRSPDVWLAEVQLGLQARAAGENGAAERHFENALAGEEATDALVNLGNVLAETGRAAEAVPLLRRAVARGAQDPGTRYSLATALAAVGLLDEAVLELDLLASDGPDGELARHNLARLRELIEQLDREEQRLTGITEQRRDDATAWRRLAETRLARGRFAPARDALGEWLSLQPEAADGWQTLTWLLTLAPDASVRDALGAAQAAERLQALRGDQDPRALEVIAAAHALNDRADHASRLIERALRLVEANPVLEAMRPRLEAAGRRYAAGNPVF